MDIADSRAAEVLDFWFALGGRDKRWFLKDPAFDADVATRFLALHEEAARGALAHWMEKPASCLALIVLLDQFPRNMFRGTARAFDTDALALRAAESAIAAGHDARLPPVQRLFLYLPFEHSESLEDQERACALTKPLAQFAETDDAYRYALLHRDIISRFGRFPHRNAALGRESTVEEEEFLKGPGSSF